MLHLAFGKGRVVGGEVEVCFGAVCGNMGFSSAEVYDHWALLSPPCLHRHLMSNCLAACTLGANWAHGRLRNSREALAEKNYNCYLLMDCLTTFFQQLSISIYTVMRRLTTGIRSEKCVFRPFRRCANAIECTYTNIDSIAYYTPRLYGIVYCS